LRVRELIELVRAHYPKRSPTDAVLDRFGLQAVARRQVGGLSGGTRRRVAVALAFAGMPDLVVLDEPTTGLDVETRRLVWSEVRAHVRGGGTVLLTTHHLEEAEELATRIVVIAEGRVLASGTTAAIRAEAGLTRIRLAAHAGSILGVEGIVRRRDHCGRVTLYARDGGEVVRRLAEAGVPLTGLEVAAASLEEAFIALTRESP
jgi:ABC-2 type transport system ATP-binding protein